jgi:hypothetical protein
VNITEDKKVEKQVEKPQPAFPMDNNTGIIDHKQMIENGRSVQIPGSISNIPFVPFNKPIKKINPNKPPQFTNKSKPYEPQMPDNPLVPKLDDKKLGNVPSDKFDNKQDGRGNKSKNPSNAP